MSRSLDPDEQAAVEQFVQANGVRRVAYDPRRDPARLSPFWRRKPKTGSYAKARQFADDIARRHNTSKPIEME